MSAAAKHNNGMHPTPHHEASHVRRVGARVMPGVRHLLNGNADGEAL